MSTRKSSRTKKVPDRYTPDNDKEYSNENDMGSPSLGKTVPNSHKSNTTSSSRRRQLAIELEKLNKINELERQHEQAELERQRREAKEQLERQQREAELKRQQQEVEMERRVEERELERKKRMLELQAELKSASFCGSQNSNSEVGGLSVRLDDQEESHSKVEKWLNDKEPSVQLSSSAVMTTAVQKLADTFRHAMSTHPPPNTMRQPLPSYSGSPEEWPMFYLAYEKSKSLFSEEENLARLRNCLEGNAFKMVKPLFVSSKNLNTVIKTLQMRFGRPEFVLESIQKKTRMLPPVKEDDTTSLIDFSTSVLNFTTTAESLCMEHYMVNPQLLGELLGKLPYSLKYNWAQHVSSMSIDKPDLKDFSSWLDKQCSIMSIYFRPQEDSASRKTYGTKMVFINNANETHDCCAFCHEKHESDKCRIFRKADVQERWKMISEKKVCFYCFRRHQLKYCKTKRVCGINGCKMSHHRLLHTTKPEAIPDQTKNLPPRNEINGNHTEKDVTKRVLLRVCPVTLYGPKCAIDTYALLDDGSTVSLLDSTIANSLGVEGKIEPLTTCWSNSTRHFDPTSRTVHLKIKGLYEDEVFSLENVRTQSRLDLPQQNIETVKLRRKWSHLNSIDQPLPTAHSKPTILIGQDNVNLILTRNVIEGPTNSPVLTWCYLGWTLHGKCAEFSNRVDEDFTLTSFEYDKLHSIVKESFEIDNYGIPSDKMKPKSADEKRAIDILQQTTRKVGDHYESGLLWKSDDFKFPSSYDNALRRYKTIERKMEKNPNFHKEYTSKIADYIEKGYVHKLTNEEASIVSDRTYYLPHFGVTNPNKPNKLRLVFDAAAKSHGVSFNDAMLSGPDYLNPLPVVLLKFRLKKIGIAGDIKEMFHQVHIREEDVNSQRFLWKNEDYGEKPDTYVMKAMTFGSTCSPSTALFVVNQNARRFATIYPEASKSILTKEYMDDLLDSVDTEEEATRRVHEIIEIHKAGGFQICNWLSNSKDVLRNLPDNLKASATKQLKCDSNLPTERILGMWWNAETDEFVFHRSAEKVKLVEASYPTKREVLKAAMSIFDPLGLVSPTTVKGRLLVQEVWRVNLSWDEVIPPKLCTKWTEWLGEVGNLQNVRIPRSYFDTPFQENAELHVFVDASEEAFAAAAYLRQKSNTSYQTMLVMARAKVAPLKPTTIPRLELQAAVLGCRLAHTIQNDMDVPIVQRIFWSDSIIILHWVKSEPRAYKQFVANRIGEIQELSSNDEWRWIPSKQNPADIATRSNKHFGPALHEEWIHGPTFLSLEQDYWPNQPSTLPTVDFEKRKQFIGVHRDLEPHFIDVDRFSSWSKLVRTTAWVLRYVHKLKSRVNSAVKLKLQAKQPIKHDDLAELTPKEINIAESLILKVTQEKSFKEEKQRLLRKQALPKSSRIYALSPFVDGNGLIRMSGRTCNTSELSQDQKLPIILNGKDRVSRMIVAKYHEDCFHQGTETVINKVRERFWITSLRSTVKSVRNKCMRCKIDNAKPTPPQMAPLPEERVSQVKHPFFFTGIDYFGPVEVTVGRRHEKRYGVIFTCLSTRAVHLEVAHSLNTESCIMAIQRFISRRPCPSEFFSDNGTNFVAAEKELKNAVKTLDHAKIQRTVAENNIKWNFNPPRAPHMGGCWERLIRSVKTALKSVMRSQFPKDEEFQTFLVRVEFILNSRPLTHVSVDPADPRPLTPNHFLREAFEVPFDEEKLCRRQLARIRTLLDGFWKRWIREYLPCLNKRCKWHSKGVRPKIGDIVVIVDDQSPRNTWPLGKITAVFPGRDNQIRVVNVRTSKGEFRRPMTKIAIISPERGEDVT